jgi:glycosyltransferase involved in cell wall biosynthesis
MTKNNTFAVLMSVYAKESVHFLDDSLKSVLNQTLAPNEIIIVKDGTVPEEINTLIELYRARQPELFKIVGYENNRGLGEALNYGLTFAQSEYVIRMDSDDVCVPERFETQMAFFANHPDVDVLGSNISEFENDPANPIRVRKVPESHEQIIKKAALMNPMNHMTVAFKRKKVLSAGGYRHAPYFEDYDLWVRMLNRGMKFHNLQKPLVLARVGNDMVGKRHGWRYFRFELDHFKKMHASGFITRLPFIKAVLLRLPLRLIPKGLLAAFYNFALRKNI